MKRLLRVETIALLTLGVACNSSDQTPPPTVELWVQLGAQSKVSASPRVRSGSDLAAAAKAWREQESEDAALQLARAYYPELLGGEPQEAAASLNPSSALSVKLPGRADEAMELTTRGHTFSVTRLDGAGRRAARHRKGASFYGNRQLWVASGAAHREGGRMLAQRMEELDVVEGGAEHRAAYRIVLPRGIAGLRDTGEYLEFSDGLGGPPVLRMHYPQVRDAKGAVRAGVIRLRGVERVAGHEGQLIAGGQVIEAEVSTDLRHLHGPLVVDPGWSSTASMAVARGNHTSTLLPSGKVLIAGGQAGATGVVTAELFDPGSGTWAATASMTFGRCYHSATLLPSGKVLVAGGSSDLSTQLNSAELFDPTDGSWTLVTATLSVARWMHTATLLASGKVLIAGGGIGGGASQSPIDSAEVFDPATGAFTDTATKMGVPRYQHTATLLSSGKVLVAGGRTTSGPSLKSVELFDPGTGAWTTLTAMMNNGRANHTATQLPSGMVLVVGGGYIIAELFDPGSGSWTLTGALKETRGYHTATLIPNGKVLITGGIFSFASTRSSAELFDPSTGLWTSTTLPMSSPRFMHTATLLPSGKVLVAGGAGSPGSPFLDTAEAYDADTGSWTATAAIMSTPRGKHSATLLTSGKVLITGGHISGSTKLNSTELLDPATGLWSPGMPMVSARVLHSSTTLASGRVLVAGGNGAAGLLNLAETFDPGTGLWTATTGTMTSPRHSHTATLLLSGKVLVAGGTGPGSTFLASAELFDPSTGTWTATATPMGTTRVRHVAVLLSSGKVLVAGGQMQSGVTASAELYDPAADSWTTLTPMIAPRSSHTATLLPSGKVLVAGGTSLTTLYNSAILFDPVAAIWTVVAQMANARSDHTATLLPSGKVLVAGGNGGTSSLDVAELFDPATGTWTSNPGTMSDKRIDHTATLMPSGKVLVAGGSSPIGPVATADLFEDSGANEAWHPTVSGPGSLVPGASAVVTGTLFRGVSGSSGGGSTDSPTDFPRLSLQRLNNGATVGLDLTSFNGTSATVSIPSSVTPGWYTVWVGVNAIYGGKTVRVGTNAAPIANAQPVSSPEDVAAPITLGASDPDGDPLVYSVVAPPSHGALGGTAPNLTYTPDGNYNGSDSFTFKVSDGNIDSAPATVSITVVPVNDAPVAEALSVTSIEDSAKAITLTGSDIEGGALSFAVATAPTHGALTGSGAALTYTPAADYNGPDSFTFRTSDGALDSAPATVSIAVSAVNDAPVADAQSVTAAEDATKTITLSGSDVEGDALAFTVLSQPDHGVLTGSGASLTYVPASNYFGADGFTFKASDGVLDSPSATVSITVNSVNDAPGAAVQSVTTVEDTPKAVTLGGSDADGDPLTFVVVTDPTHGTLSGSAPNLTYTPAADYSGADGFTFKANDGAEDSPPAAVSITVTAVNDAPVFEALSDQVVLKDSGTHLVPVVGVGPGGGVDEAASQTVTLTVTSSAPAIVPDPTLTGTGPSRSLVFIPAATRGTAFITVTAQDSGGTAGGGVDTFSRTFTVTVSSPNHSPLAQAGSATSDGLPVALTLEGQDVDGDSLSFTTLTQPAHGALSGTAPNLSYAPEVGFSGVDSFTFQVNDGLVDSDPATFSITVYGVSDTQPSHYGWSCSSSGGGGGPLGLAALLAVLALRLRLRRRGLTGATGVAVLVALFALPVAAEEAVSAKAPVPSVKTLKLAFLGVTAGTGVVAQTAASVSGYVQSELISLGAYEVTGQSEIAAMLGLERQKQLLGCSEGSATCLSEIAGALDSDRAISGDLSHIGDTTLLNLSLIDLRTSRPVSRVGRRVQGSGATESVLDVVGPAIYELVSADPALQGRKLKFERAFGGLVVAVRGEFDIAGRSIAPAVAAELSGRKFGGALAILIGPTAGFRAEGRYYPVELARVRPYLALGATVFAPAVGLRGAAGAEMRFGQLHVFADAAFERFVNDSGRYNPNAVLLSAGTGWLF